MSQLAGSSPAIIEVALNGGTPKSRNPNSPRTPDEIAADGIACIDAGAAIVHNHNEEPVIGRNGVHSPVPYEQAWRQILAKHPDAILYPTMAGGGPHTNIEERYAHIPALAEAGVLRCGLVDPGSTNFGGEDAEGLPAAVDVLYQNTYADARHMFAECTRLGVPASISIFEPGFLRVALAYQRAGKMPPGSLIKLYFSGRELGFGLPPTLPSLQAYLAMLEGTGLSWSVAVLGGDVIERGLARLALERGGHIRVGLEDYAGPRTPANVELVREAVALCEAVGRPVAGCPEAAKVLGMAPRT